MQMSVLEDQCTAVGSFFSRQQALIVPFKGDLGAGPLLTHVIRPFDACTFHLNHLNPVLTVIGKQHSPLVA